MRLFACALLLGCASHSGAQDLIVHVVDNKSQQPVDGALVRLHYGCWHSMRPIELKQKTDTAGVATFHALSLSPLEFCIAIDADTYAQQEGTYAFTTPEYAEEYAKYAGEVMTALPAEITLHVRKLSIAERIRNLFRYD